MRIITWLLLLATIISAVLFYRSSKENLELRQENAEMRYELQNK